MDGEMLNFCRVGQMSICTAATTGDQADCVYFEKSRQAGRCMYFVFDEYCDCLKAQIQARNLR